MPIKRLIVAAALATALLVAGPVQAADGAGANATSIAGQAAAQPFNSLAGLSPAPMLVQSAVPADASSLLASKAPTPAAAASAEAADLRKTLIALAMKLRDTRYVRGGRSPSTGFDCSGFVRYVFAHAIGLDLPANSAAQFLAGLKVKRADMQPGDLVFFRTRGKQRVSHVGIYIDNGRFIHSPSAGKSVEVSSLDEGYWSKRFIGARRPSVAQNG